MRKAPALGLAAVGALVLGLAGGAAGSTGAGALGWAAAAGVFLMLMLRGRGIVVMGVLLALLAVGAGVAAALVGGWAWVLLVPALFLLAGAVGAVRRGATWATAGGSGPRAGEQDAWKQFDLGEDPTDVVGDSDSR